MNIKSEIARQIGIFEADKAEEELAYDLTRSREYEMQMEPIRNGSLIQCKTWGKGLVRGIIHECKHFYESRWSPCFCTHKAVKHETNPHWKNSSCEGIGKDLGCSEVHNNHPLWCPLMK